ncbi:FKBP-type peptidyl-prolyl cis-trans isomerase [Erythrobacter sp. SDW2]|uniref:FKBP-type peptidyl-prolyl cis-trans isomerase n=1 Tax=Erythrobacter sp. SDW2 TaxID=2907154 RepID=UPI001F28BE82|nr:FKBP-type peptidyl-prolyl cis-trans isomerase [Erythrobacter sp. SDW2]UIP06568.1 FKBP-type peptidyl-prolyl cis-trans isomerase [Erythrobacter sp. SDW2]
MTEVTRVPIQPIAKGSLTKLWLGVIVAALIGAGIAFAAVPRGIDLDTITEGTGGTPKIGDVVFIKYVGKLPDGTEFDRSRPLPIPPGIFPDGTPMLLEPGQQIEGFFQGLQQMEKGGKYKLEIPAALAYGETSPSPAIPANSDLVFEVEMVDFMSRADADAKMAALEKAMQAAQAAQGGDQPAEEPAAPSN